MSVIVKGMEMPKEESITIQILPSGAVYLEDKLVYEACAVEIPTPHGRLIDADKLNIHDVSPAYGFCVMGVTEEDIELADTVIEAEGRDDTE